MSLPTPYTLQVKRRIVGAKDAHGKKVVTYGPAEDWPVSGIAPGSFGSSLGNSNQDSPNRDLSVILWTVFAPPHCNAPGELDIVEVDGEDFSVQGRPSDWTSGPWANPSAGVVVELKRVEG